MANFKVVIGQKDGKTVQKEIGEEKSSALIGKKIDDKVDGNDIGFEGYEFVVTGGSDVSGTPMRKDAEGVGKRKILCVEGIGVHRQRKGLRQRKTVCGNTITDTITQVNLKITKAGSAPLVAPAAEGAKTEG